MSTSLIDYFEELSADGNSESDPYDDYSGSDDVRPVPKTRPSPVLPLITPPFIFVYHHRLLHLISANTLVIMWLWLLVSCQCDRLDKYHKRIFYGVYIYI